MDDDIVEIADDEYFDASPPGIHPRLEDMIAQRAYAGTILIGRLSEIGDADLRKVGLDLVNAIIRSIASTATPVSKIRG